MVAVNGSLNMRFSGVEFTGGAKISESFKPRTAISVNIYEPEYPLGVS